jgi:nanoRNase/pAp phosphatase (c-di-AMP/oligoRNAs hydrolase)
MHFGPDPDCIGAAVGMKRIIQSWDADAKISIVHGGEISHKQNQTMVNVLNLQFTNLSEIENVGEFADAYVVVDVVPERCGLEDVPVLMVVDHHKGDTKNAVIKDIRLVGSASTLVWTYMDELGIVLDKTNEDDARVATAMLMGIKTDTSDLVTDAVADVDFQAYKNLIGSINQSHLATIINYPIPPYYIELRKRLDNEDHIVEGKGYVIGGIGYIHPAQRDALPSIAEERARIEGTNTSFIMAIVGSNLEVSIRSSSQSLEVHKTCQNIFGKKYSGGKPGAGAAKIPMGNFAVDEEDDDTQAEAWEFIRKLWFKRIQREMANHR